MSSLLLKVKAKISIYSRQKTKGLLEGEYRSVFKGRSLDFDDLREYVLGDDIKDIDWKASARSGQILIRRYVAIRKRNILLVVNTGREMTAETSDGSKKKDSLIMAAGMIGYIAQKHGDLVGMVFGNVLKSTFMPLKGSSAQLENMLQQVDKDIEPENSQGNISTQLDYIARSVRKRMILVVLADEQKIDKKILQLIRRLRVQHEILWLTISDFSYSQQESSALFDVTSQGYLSNFIVDNPGVKKSFLAHQVSSLEHRSKELEKLNVISGYIKGESDVIPAVFHLLERQKHARPS